MSEKRHLLLTIHQLSAWARNFKMEINVPLYILSSMFFMDQYARRVAVEHKEAV